MKKHTISDVFKTRDTKPETAMDKTTRVARQMLDEEAEQRLAKITRLRKTRLEREANTPSGSTPKAQRTTQRS